MRKQINTVIFLSILFYPGRSQPGARDLPIQKLRLNSAEEVVFRREMAEMDINIRALASAIATGHTGELVNAASALRSFQFARSPRFKNALDGLKAKLHRRDWLGYFSQIHREAAQLHEYAARRRSNLRPDDWHII